MSICSICNPCDNQPFCKCNCHTAQYTCNNQFLRNAVDDELEVNTEYFLPSEFNVMKGENDSNSLISCVHFNCRSLKSNYDNLVSCVNSLDLGQSIIGVSETWLQHGENIVCPIPHYNFIGRGRTDNRGGGV